MLMPVTIAFHNHETPLSAASRLAAANGYASLRQFLEHTGLKTSAIEEGEFAAINRLSTLSGIPKADLSRFALRPVSPGIYNIGAVRTRQRTDLKSAFRFCPCCIVEDRETGIGKPIARAYHRFDWLVPGVDHCLIHGAELHYLQKPRDFEFPWIIDRNYPEIATLAATAKRDGAPLSEAYVSRRVDGAMTNEFLDGLELYVAFDLCFHLGRFMEKRTRAVGALTTLERGYAVAKGGEEAIDGAVVEAIAHRRPHGAAIRGFIGPLLDSLFKNKADPHYAKLLDVLQTIALRRLPFGPGHTLFRPVDRRVLHSIASASAEYGMGVDRVKAVIAATGLVATNSAANSIPWFDAERARPFLEAAADGLSDANIASLLDVSVPAATELRRSRIFEGGKSRSGKRGVLNISAAAIAALQDLLRRNATPNPENENTIRLSGVAFSVLPATLNLARDGLLTTLAIHGEGGKLSDFHVDIADLRQAIERQTAIESARSVVPDGFDQVSKVSDDLGVPAHIIRQMIKTDLLKATVRLNPFTKRRELVVASSSVRSFRDEHVRLPAIAHTLGISKEATKALLVERSIKRKAGGAALSSRYYLRADVEGLMQDFSKSNKRCE
jgi:hypothetical protein